MNYTINKNLRLNFAVYNLLNKSFAEYIQYGNNSTDIGNLYNYIQEGRRYYVSINMDF